MRALPLAILLAACSAAPEPAPEDVTQTEATTPAPPPEASPFPADYAALREGARAFAAETAEAEQRGRALAGENGYSPWFDTLDCTIPDIEPFERAPRDIRLEALAHEATVIEARLRGFGYVPEIWHEPLRRWERAALAIVSTETVPAFGDPGYDSFEQRLSALHEQFTAEIEANRARLQPDALPIRREGGCGAAESPVIVKADPPGGRIWITTRFTFDVCRAKRLDPWDLNTCRWAEMDPDSEAWLSGTYMVQGKWPGGASVRTNRKITSEDPDQSVTVTIRPG
jgi:hypothetical protein